MQDYRKLRVWKKSFGLALDARRATEGFPRQGYASLKDQIIRAAESIVFNVVEGCGAGTQKEFGRFLSIAIKSAIELEAQLELAHGYGSLSDEGWQALSAAVIDTRRMLYGLRKRVLALDPSRSISHVRTD